MTKNSKIYLTISLILLAIGGAAILTKQTTIPAQLFVALPLGAIFFGLFLVSLIMHREASHFTKDEHERGQAAGSHSAKH